MVVYPVGTKPMGNSNENSNAVLGTPLYRWNLNAGAIDAYNISAKNIFIDDGIYISNRKLATEEWTMEWIDWLASKIKDSSGGSGGSASGSFSGLNNMANNLVKLLNSLTLYGGLTATGGNSPSQTTYEPGGALNELHIKFPTVSFHVSSGNDGGASFDASKHASFSETTLAIRGDKLPIGTGGSCGGTTWGNSSMISDAINKVAGVVDTKAVGSFSDGTCAADGKVTIPYSSVNGTSLGNITFDMAGTAFYKKHAVAKFYIAALSKTASSPGMSGATYSPSISEVSIKWADDGKSGTVDYGITALDESSILSGTININSTIPYKKGYYDAASALKWSGDTLKYPVMASATGTATTGDMAITIEMDYNTGNTKCRPKVTIHGHTLYGSWDDTCYKAGAASVTASDISFSTSWHDSDPGGDASGTARSITGGDTKYLKVSASLNGSSRTIRSKITASNSASSDDDE